MIKKVLVTGAAGFIGSHLCGELLRLGHLVTGIDSLTETYNPQQKKKNIADLQGSLEAPNFIFIEEDLLNRLDLDFLNEFQIVFHLAAEAGVRKSWGEEFEIYETRNISLSQKILEGLKGCSNIEKIIYASSSSVYGNRKKEPCAETDLCQPFSPYGMTKMAGEHLFHLYFQNFQMPCSSVRFFTVFGPRQRPDMGFHIFIKNALEGEKSSIFGDGKQSRDFTFVDDAVQGLILTAFQGKDGEVYNIGGGCPAVLDHVLDILSLHLPTFQFEKISPQKGDVRHTCADIRKAKEHLGYSPKVSLEEGLQKEIAWIKQFYSF